jgi:hypothetical protein
MAALAKLAFSVLCETQTKAAKEAEERFEKQMKETQENIKKRFDALQLLRVNGLVPERDESYIQCDLRYGIDPVRVREMKLFQKIHDIFGKLEMYDKELHNAEKREIQVYLTPKDEKYKGIVQFSYIRVLKDSDPCKIEEKEMPASSYKTLVCSVAK